jgi:hypothetical protein
MKTLAITGSSGFVGTNLRKLFDRIFCFRSTSFKENK